MPDLALPILASRIPDILAFRSYYHANCPMQEFFLIIAITLVVLYWLSAIRCKDIAIAAARRECKLCDVQLLDQTVQQQRISMSRDQTGQWRVWRQYKFEYSDNGVDRLSGTLTILGTRVVRIALETFNPIIH